jgi:uncharacterized membrane protein
MSRLVQQRITTSFIFLLLLLLGVVFFLISIDLIGLAFTKLGFPPRYSVLLLFLSLIGSYINIPIKEIVSREPVISGRIVNSGTLGSLIGADLLNLKKIPGLGTQVASIGGAGTFDGIFLTEIISVLLA